MGENDFMTAAQVRTLLYQSEEETRDYVEKRDAALREFIIEQRKSADELSKAHRAAIELRLKNGGVKIAGMEHAIYGNGDPGIKTKVDRLVVESGSLAKERASDKQFIRNWSLVFGTAILSLITGWIIFLVTK